MAFAHDACGCSFSDPCGDDCDRVLMNQALCCQGQMSVRNAGGLRSVYPCRSVTRAMAKGSDSELPAARSNERGALCDRVRLRSRMCICLSSLHLLPRFCTLRQRFHVLGLSSREFLLIGARNGQGVYLTWSLSRRGTPRKRLHLTEFSPFCLLILWPLPPITGFRYDCLHLLEFDVLLNYHVMMGIWFWLRTHTYAQFLQYIFDILIGSADVCSAWCNPFLLLEEPVTV